jgi:hypothetical protein
MAKTSKAKPFSIVAEEDVRALLLEMEGDARYNTASRYVADSEKYPDNVITFSEQHLEHLRKFPDVNPHQYISNLRLMTKL